MKEFQENKITFENVSKNTLESILKFFYTGNIEITSENAFDILLFASKYLIEELIKILSQFIMENCQIENVVDILRISESMDFVEMENYCYNFMCENLNDFSNSVFFYQLEEDQIEKLLEKENWKINDLEVVEALARWGKSKLNFAPDFEKLDREKKELVKNKISDFLDKIRLIDFSQQELQKVYKMGLIEKDLKAKIKNIQAMSGLANQEKRKKLIKEYKQSENPGSLRFKSKFRHGSKILDSQKIKILKEFLNDNEFLEQMQLAFSSENDGFKSESFHQKCDEKGKTLVLIKTMNDFILGGYSKVGWNLKITSQRDPDSFLFSIVNPKKTNPIKLSTIDPSESVIYSFIDDGPNWGAPDLRLNHNMKEISVNLGVRFELPPNIPMSKSSEFLVGSSKEEVVEIEIDSSIIFRIIVDFNQISTKGWDLIQVPSLMKGKIEFTFLNNS
eukprot:Anaeramoba_ignava/a224926_5.p1 GENE.a224926_5~~a224926_5.p1  ORF type:complete len:448 (-),score=162.47 a224926_5:13-1356(-)